MKNVVDILCFSSDKRLEMRVFDGLRGLVRLAGQTVEYCGYGRKHARIYALAEAMDSVVRFGRDEK